MRYTMLSIVALMPLVIVSGSRGYVAAKTYPTYIDSMEVGKWYSLSGDTPDLSLSATNYAEDVNPGVSNGYAGNTGFVSIMDAWNGGVFASGYGTYGTLISHGGGHVDYHGNEIIGWDLNTRAWSVIKSPYAVGAFSSPVTNGFFPDGSPNVPHYYGQMAYRPSTNSLITGVTQVANTPTKEANGGQFLFDSGTWRTNATNSGASHIGSGGYGVYDSSRDAVWFLGAATGANELASFDPDADNGGTWGAWTTHGHWAGITEQYLALGYIPPASSSAPDLLVVVLPSGGVFTIDPTNPTNSPVELTVGGTAPADMSGGNLVYSHALDGLLFCTTTNPEDVHLLKKTAGSWAWSMVTDAGNTTVPEANVGTAGCFNRFQLARYISKELAIVVDQVNMAVYGMRIA